MLYYTIPQAAKLLGRTRQDVWYLVKNNKIKSFKIGRLYVITQGDLGNYILNKISGSSGNDTTDVHSNNIGSKVPDEAKFNSSKETISKLNSLTGNTNDNEQ